MINYIKNLMAYLFEITFIYYLLPLLLVDTTSSMISLFIIVPTLLIVISFSYGFETKKLDLIYVLATGILFIPVMFISMNTSAFIYAIIYTILAFIANLLGYILVRNKSSKNKKK